MTCPKTILVCAMLSCACMLFAQQNMHFTNPAIAGILQGNYDPAEYAAPEVYDTPEELVAFLNDAISPDSLKSYLFGLRQFETRNTGSDTLSDSRGMGAARRWVLEKFADFDARSGGRLETGYFQFDQQVCGMGRHKNVVALIPGMVPSAELIVIEAHLDSRCSTSCDVDCLAQGMEDNGSGTALVIELARTMSAYAYNSSILLVATTGEEQGLVGANALAEHLTQENIPVKMVQNNDIVGGIICGATSSPPSCPGEDLIDSTQVRMFSAGSSASLHKGICRFVKMQYNEMLQPIAQVPMLLTIMSSEDRAGRGGDHIPFRQRGIPAMRFTSAHEHGDASNSPGYHDRQHTSDDLLGVDLDGDGSLDSFFVDFNYLARNTAINATSAAMAAIGPASPTIGEAWYGNDKNLYVSIDDPAGYDRYVVGVRIDQQDFDTLHYLDGVTSGVFQTEEKELFIFVSVAAIDDNGVESLFSLEQTVLLTGTEEIPQEAEQNIRLLPNKPNPFDESTVLAFWVDEPVTYGEAFIAVYDLRGHLVARLETPVRQGMNEVLFHHGYGVSGVLTQVLFIDGQRIDARHMTFAQ